MRGAPLAATSEQTHGGGGSGACTRLMQFVGEKIAGRGAAEESRCFHGEGSGGDKTMERRVEENTRC